jgi:4-azaleucine resistance transporter AzlC
LSTEPTAARAGGAARDFALGAYHMLPLLAGMVPFALLLGALGADKGYAPLEMALMSATVFAGSAQFIAIELWRDPLPMLTIVLTTALVNLRHVPMSAALAASLDRFGPRWPFAALFLMADEIWAVAMRAARGGSLGPAYYAGLAIPFYLNWIFWATLGTVAGRVIAEPERYGFDFAFTAVFIVLIRGFWRGRASLLPVAASIAGALLSAKLLPGAWYILVGTAAGMVVATLAWRPDHAA